MLRRSVQAGDDPPWQASPLEWPFAEEYKYLYVLTRLRPNFGVSLQSPNLRGSNPCSLYKQTISK
jgi:hypothetical protein